MVVVVVVLVVRRGTGMCSSRGLMVIVLVIAMVCTEIVARHVDERSNVMPRWLLLMM